MTLTKLTAWNQDVSQEENHANMRKLMQALLAQNLYFEEIQVKWRNRMEPAYLIQDIPLETTHQLARFFKQEAFVHQDLLVEVYRKETA